MRSVRDFRAARGRLLSLAYRVGIDDMAVTAAWLRQQLRASRQRRRRSVTISLSTGDLIDAALRELIDIRRGTGVSAGGSSRAS